MTDWGCSWSYWMSYRKSGMFQRCSIVSNSQIQEGKQKLHSRDSICWMLISCDSQEHHWISTTTTPMWDQFGSTQNTETASYSYYLPGWAIKSYKIVSLSRSYRIQPTSRNGGPILCKFSKFQGVESRWKVWYKMIQDIWGLCCVCEVHQWFCALTIQHSGKMMIWGYCGSFAFICSLNELPNSRMTPRGVRGSKPIFADRDPREEKKELDGLKPRTEARMDEFISCQDHWDPHNPWQVVASKALEKDIRHTKNTYSVYIHIGVQMKFSVHPIH